MATGMEMMLSSMVKAMGLNPDDLKEQAGQLLKLAVDLKEQVNRIEQQNIEIIDLLKSRPLVIDMVKRDAQTDTKAANSGEHGEQSHD